MKSYIGAIFCIIHRTELFGFLMLLTLIFSCASDDQLLNNAEQDKVVATVNGHQIFQSDITRRMEALFKNSAQMEGDKAQKGLIQEQALEAEIIDRLMLEKARKEGFKIEQDRLEKELDRTRQLLGKEAFEEMLRQRNATEEQYRTFLGEQILISDYRNFLTKDLDVTEDITKKYFNGHRQRFFEPPSVRLEIVTVENMNEVSVIEDKFRSGVSWDQITAYAKQLKTVLKTIRTRWMPYNAIPRHLNLDAVKSPEGKVVTRRLKENEIMIVRIAQKRNGRELIYDEVQEEIRALLLRREKQRAVYQWYLANAKGADIKDFRN